jgi:SpoVK/Ycf46/Vps4 family AAA+-type ATPase
VAGKHIKQMIAAYRDGDDLAFRRAAQAIIEEEEAKRHPALAREMRQLLAAAAGHTASVDINPVPNPPMDPERDMPLADIASPRRYLRDLVLNDRLSHDMKTLVQETRRWSEIDAAGLPRRQRLLLHGPPGCGKSSIAEALAGELGRLLVIVRVDAVVSSYLGETASNLRRLFEFAATGPFVLLFDEFDALGKERADPADHGELRRVVNAFLQLLDRFRGPSLVIAATNHEAVLDYALWRRFDDVVEVPTPTTDELVRVLEAELRRTLQPETIRRAAKRLDGLPHAAAERVARDTLRAALLDNSPQVTPAHLDEAVSRALSRPWT